MEQQKTPHEALAGRRVLITGGTTGIGRATLLALAAQDARILTFGREEEALRHALSLAGLSDDSGLNADASSAADIEKIFAAVDDRLGGIDVLVACAALGAQPIHEMSDADWRYVVETNLVGTMACTRGALERMVAQGSGQILLVSSISPEIKAPGESVYAATKAGIDAFALTLRKEVSEKGVRICVIQPGSVGSDMQPCTDREQREAIARGEMLFAEEVAEAIAFVLTRSGRCDIPTLRIEPINQKTG
ncbi:SDR family oxidoreductase [Novosphingobium gossypii]|uniref:SDR family oxidoreductase n=1 Tax=Novosphingobium gossypii TaxID=1604774 RepID=UPI003D1AD165